VSARRVVEVRVPVSHDRALDVFEHRARHALRVVLGLQQERWNHAEQHRFADPGRPVGTEVPGYLAGAHREAGEDDILVEREMVEQRLQIARERVVVT
jgi:hypothetical protein